MAVTIGRITLRPHQVSAVARLREMISLTGGALLADEAGLGKTYVAATIAREAAAPLIVGPAALRDMWAGALGATGVAATFVSFEGLSRGKGADIVPDLVVVDEAHHARNRATRRYRALAALTSRARVLLLTATPIHNRRRDLEALLALFLGERAAGLADEDLARCVVRRDRGSVDLQARPPATVPPVWLSVAHDESVLDELLSLPPPVPPADGGDGGALLAHSLVRQWASSDGALRGALDRRAARAATIVEALTAGRHPTRAELRHWSFGDGAVQLAFPELMASATSDGAALLEAVQLHAQAVDHVRSALRNRPSLDAQRAVQIAGIRARHSGERIVAFTAYAETASALYRELRGSGRVAVLTGQGARIAGGTLGRRETMERFAPVAHGVQPPREAEEIDLLLATDLLSEGVNLQDASVVIHLDLPWTPARIEQRVGRAARIGSIHQSVAVYALSPPASAERLIGVERRLREKLGIARRAVGMSSIILPSLLPSMTDDSVTGTNASPATEMIRQALARWTDHEASAPPGAVPVAAVAAPERGFLAAISTAHGPVLIGGIAGAVGCDSGTVAAAVRNAEGAECSADTNLLEEALRQIGRWKAARRAALDAGVGPAEPLRRRIVARIADIVHRTPAHRRPPVARTAARIRASVQAYLGAGAERGLAELAAARLSDEEWLAAVGDFIAVHRVAAPPGASGLLEGPELVALILLQRAT